MRTCTYADFVARVRDLGSNYSVALGPAAVDRFRGRWPAHNLSALRRVTFEYEKRNGDLVDARCNGRGSCEKFDGEALKALSEDAQCIGERRVKPPHDPRCKGTDWKQLAGARRVVTGAARAAMQASPVCRTNLSSCMKNAVKVGDARKKAAMGMCLRDFNACKKPKR